MLDGLIELSTFHTPKAEQPTSARCIEVAKVHANVVVVIDIEVEVVMTLILLVRCVL